jgi:WhiB family redox-sensing transcriptional regulator
MITHEFMQHGACADDEIDPEMFFPISEADTARIAQAKLICADCPVKAQCLEYALAHGLEGVWGGMTDAERDALRRRTLSDGDVAEGVAA